VIKKNNQFYSSLLDSIDNQIAVIDGQATIVYVNKSWRDFASSNGGDANYKWEGNNYLNGCSPDVDDVGCTIDEISAGIRQVLSGELESFSADYPCDSPTQRLWFAMTISAMPIAENVFYLISHANITARKLAEEKVIELSMSDPLTLLANRRHLDLHIEQEWQRGIRSGKPISIIMIDIDYFKKYNDGFGHVKGDECLRQVSQEIKIFARRPGDLAARFGGEEFMLVMNNTDLWQAKDIAERLRQAVMKLNICNVDGQRLTVSIGISSEVPSADKVSLDAIAIADNALYLAKKNGRNRVELGDVVNSVHAVASI